MNKHCGRKKHRSLDFLAPCIGWETNPSSGDLDSSLGGLELEKKTDPLFKKKVYPRLDESSKEVKKETT